MKNFDSDKEQRIIISHLLGSEQYAWMDSVAKLPGNIFDQKKYMLRFDPDFMRNYDENLVLCFISILRSYTRNTVIYRSYLKE